MKYRLLAPGPTPIPDRVLKEMNQSIIHHRTEKFEAVFSECQVGLKWLLGSSTAPLMISASGTGAIEASMQSFLCAGDTILCVTGGKFGDNWFKMARNFGLNAIEIPVTWGWVVDPQQVRDAFVQHPHTRAVIMVASETSTGVRQPYEDIALIVKEHDALMMLDAVTALGVFDINPDHQHIDVMLAGSQKGLMLPPGLGFVWASEKAWRFNARSNLPKFYFDLSKEKKAQANSQTSYTPPVSLIMGLKEVLLMMKEEGRDAIFSRHTRLAHACRAGISALELELFTKYPTEAITSVYSPQALAPDAVYDGLMSMANCTIAGGQEHLAGKIFRIGHMGYVDEIDLIGVLGALEIILRRLGYEHFVMGSSLKAALPILQEGFVTR